MTYVLEQGADGTNLVVTGAWSADDEECIRSDAADGLVLNHARGYQGDDLSFLPGLPLRRRDILDRSLGSGALGDRGSDDDPGHEGASPAGKPRRAGGVSVPCRAGDLPRQEPGQYPALGRAKSPTLRRVQFPHCRRLTDISAIAACPAVSFFDLGDGAELQDVEALRGLGGLDTLYLWGSTKVVSGDISPIAGLSRLRDFRMVDRTWYSPSVSSIQAEIESRTESPR